MTRESLILKAINALRFPGRLWRNSKGGAWQGGSIIGARSVSPVTRENLERHRACLRPGDVVLRGARFNQFGLLAPGSSDTVGYSTVQITEAMVGQTVAVFTAIEAKAPGRPVDPEQRRFVDWIIGAGGIAGIARSEADARQIIEAKIQALQGITPEP